MASNQDYIANIKRPAWATKVQGPPELLDIEQVTRRIQDVSTLPHIAVKMIDICRQPNVGAADLTTLVESDPALCVRVLRCVNSAAAGLRYKVTCLQRAVAYLGFKEIRNLAITASVAHIFRHNQIVGPYNRRGLWRHMVATAVAARMVAARCQIEDFQDAFLGGLLHDIGIILEDQYCHASFLYLMKHMRPDVLLIDAETSVLGFDHTILGARMARHWKFPDDIVDAIRFHHVPDKYRGPQPRMLAAIAVGNMLCTLKDVRSIADLQQPAPPAPLDVLGLERDDIVVFADDLDAEIEQYQYLFSV
ncbi:MAG: HDOD domain-containing protein [Phycisphaeraceae bacterium]|nr:HDOD domain-containing protein [Phycisphaeraceae bacterium]